MSIIERALRKAQSKKVEPVTRSQPVLTEDSTPAPASIESEATVAFNEAGIASSGVGRGDKIEIRMDELRKNGCLAPVSKAQQAEEEFRRIKWPLLNSIFGRDGAVASTNNVVLITSAVPGEGKTFNTLNLALSLAREPDLQVLLVDGDVARPSLTISLGLAEYPGLTDLVADMTLDAAAVIHPTSVDRLFVLPAGPARDNSPELLSSARMANVIEDLSRRASPGVVIFDSPPILATNEAQVLSRYAGQIVMIVMADSTEQSVVTEALALLDRSKPISAVLNRVEPTFMSTYYSHYYYQHYGYGEGKRR